MCIHSQLNWLLDTPLCWSSLWNLYTLNHSNNKGAIKLKLALALNWLRLLLIPLNYKVHQHSVSNLFTLLANHVFGLYIRTHRTQYFHVSSSNMFIQSCIFFKYVQPIMWLLQICSSNHVSSSNSFSQSCDFFKYIYPIMCPLQIFSANHVTSSNIFIQSCVSFLYFQPITQESEWRWMEVWKSLVVKQQCYVAMSQKCSFVHGTQSMIS